MTIAWFHEEPEWTEHPTLRTVDPSRRCFETPAWYILTHDEGLCVQCNTFKRHLTWIDMDIDMILKGHKTDSIYITMIQSMDIGALSPDAQEEVCLKHLIAIARQNTDR